MQWSSIKAKEVSVGLYISFSIVLLIAVLGGYIYINSAIYVVMLGDRELGMVEDKENLEFFVENLTEGCTDLYGLSVELAENVSFIKVYDSAGSPDQVAVENKIRNHAEFIADAYQIKIDGEPFAPIYSPEELDKAINSIKEAYINKDSATRLIDVYVVEKLELERCTAPPHEILSADEVVAVLMENTTNNEDIYKLAALDTTTRGSLESRQSGSQSYHSESVSNEVSISDLAAEAEVSRLHVKTLEEITVIEKIAFPVEYIYDDKLPVTQSEITTPGIEGEKSVVYQVVSKNGIEIERTVINEDIIEEPLAQVETKGLKELPSIGTGQFVWPVRGEGIIYNGFSSWHTAIDIHIDYGTAVLAADAGLVTYSGYGSTQGNYLIIHHGAYWTLYLHNSENLVSKGERVSKGQVIARVGTSGRTTGAHLHFEVRADDGTGQWHSYYQHQALNPLQFFRR